MIVTGVDQKRKDSNTLLKGLKECRSDSSTLIKTGYPTLFTVKIIVLNSSFSIKRYEREGDCVVSSFGKQLYRLGVLSS